MALAPRALRRADLSSRVRFTLKLGSAVYINSRAFRELESLYKLYIGVPLGGNRPKWKLAREMFNRLGKAGALNGNLWISRDARKLSYKRSKSNPHVLGVLMRKKVPTANGIKFAFKAPSIPRRYVRATEPAVVQAEGILEEALNPWSTPGPAPKKAEKGPIRVGIWA